MAKKILIIVAVVAFSLAALGVGVVKGIVMVPLGLAFFAVSFLV
jgi:hypothetical protein